MISLTCNWIDNCSKDITSVAWIIYWINIHYIMYNENCVHIIYYVLYTSRGISELKIISNIPRHLFPVFARNK